MADFSTGLARFIVRAVLVLMALVFVASLLVVLLLVATLWGLRALWAKLTGQPVNPWVMRVNPGAGWNRVFKAADHWQPAARARQTPPGPPGPPRELSDVTDVQAKEP
ncbi:hypothetical protein [Rhodoferax sp.]|uniref:hypothetical protein n=1 Tax=Rhodoferax sp. TaxID=50421 RepID=UPI00374CC102